MLQILSEPIDVIMSSVGARHASPVSLCWHNRDYPVTQVGLHHTVRLGRVLHHIFSVTSHDLFFRLNLNTETLHWTLEEISDGLPN